MEQKTIKAISNLPANLQDRFKMLYMLSDQRSKIQDAFSAEIDGLSAIFKAKKQPHYDERANIISAKTTNFEEYLPKYDAMHIQLETIVAGIVKTPEQTEEDAQEIKEHIPTPTQYLENIDGIPNFWGVCVKNNRMMQQIVRDRDAVPLEKITDVHIEETFEKKKKQLRITLIFAENDFFTNTELSVKIYYVDSEGDSVKKTEGTAIEWKEGMDLTVKKFKKQQKNKRTGEVRHITTTKSCDSFFNCFGSYVMPVVESDDDNEDQDEEKAKLFEIIDETVQMSEDVRDMHEDALSYYLNFTGDMIDEDGYRGYGDEDDSDEEDNLED